MLNFKGKNIIYLFADQWRRDALGFYTEGVITPNFDSFMRESFVFDRAYSSCPVCSPHRACLMTGQYPLTNGVYSNCKPELDIQLDENTICVGDVFQESGYKTGYIGKWHLDKPDGRGGWDAYTPPGKRRHGFDFWYSYGAADDHLTPYYWRDTVETHVNQWSPEHEVDVAINFIQGNKTNPFCLFISWNPPHSPYDLTPQKYVDAYKKFPHKDNIKEKNRFHHTGEAVDDDLEKSIKGYYGAITGLDEQFGRLVAFLKENDLYDNTILVISADHGDMMGSHGLMGKYVWYEEAVGIPLVIGGGDITHKRSNVLIGSPDQAVTLLGLLELEIPESMQGLDYSSLVKGGTCKGHSSLYLGGFTNMKQYVQKFEKNGLNPMAYGWRSLVTERYKLAIHRGYQLGEHGMTALYDLQNDPLEQHPIMDKVVENKLKAELQEWLDRLDDPFEVK